MLDKEHPADRDNVRAGAMVVDADAPERALLNKFSLAH